MIIVNQLKSEMKWKGKRLTVRDMLDEPHILKQKVAKQLKIKETDIETVEIKEKHSPFVPKQSFDDTIENTVYIPSELAQEEEKAIEGQETLF